MAKLYLGLVLYTGYHQWRWGKVLRQKFTRMMMYHPYLTQLLTIGLHRMNGRITFSYNRINHKNIRYCAYPNWIWCSASCPHLLTLSPRPCLLSKPEPLLTPRHNHPPYSHPSYVHTLHYRNKRTILLDVVIYIVSYCDDNTQYTFVLSINHPTLKYNPVSTEQATSSSSLNSETSIPNIALQSLSAH